MTREMFVQETVDWIRTRLLPPGAALGPDTPLFRDGLIDSIRILKLIAWTEHATGARIPDEMIRMDHFESVSRIAETFVREP